MTTTRSSQVEIAKREMIVVTQIYPNYDSELSRRPLRVDLIPDKSHKCDIRLGMDFVSSHGTRIKFKEKRHRVKLQRNDEIVFKGQQVRKF